MRPGGPRGRLGNERRVVVPWCNRSDGHRRRAEVPDMAKQNGGQPTLRPTPEGSSARVRNAISDSRKASSADQMVADADQSASDADQVSSDIDQTASDRDQTSADLDQLASDHGQATADKDEGAARSLAPGE